MRGRGAGETMRRVMTVDTAGYGRHFRRRSLAQRYIGVVDLGMGQSVCIDGPRRPARGGQWQSFEVAVLQPVAWVARRVVAGGLP